MAEDRVLEILTRIAVALERQVSQYDESVARNLQLRDENIKRHEQERDDELAEARAANEELRAQLNAVVENGNAIVAIHKANKAQQQQGAQ